MDLVQFGIGFRGCLFDPDPSVCEGLIEQIGQGVGVARQLGAHVCLIRTGSLSPNGSYSPSRANHTQESWRRLVDSMRRVAALAEEAEQTVVIEPTC
ncbi:MAG: hypothetical protein HC802_05655 [Caldilineaceae bacterium]|nr:hypothetical protein [Caldilineaceae bacterium]